MPIKTKKVAIAVIRKDLSVLATENRTYINGQPIVAIDEDGNIGLKFGDWDFENDDESEGTPFNDLPWAIDPAGGTGGGTGGGPTAFADITGVPADNTSLAAALGGKQAALGYTAENVSNKNSANGYAGLDGTGKIAAAQLPSYVDDVLEYANYAALPVTGETGKIYVAIDTNAEYRWSGSAYIQLVASPGSTDAVPEGSNLYFTVARVLAAVLTGVGFGSATAITAADTILAAFGKLQAQINNLSNIFQPKEGQRLSTTDSPTFSNITSSGRIEGAAANLDSVDLSAFYGSAIAKMLIGNNRTGSEAELDFISTPGTAAFAKGGFKFILIKHDGTELDLLKISGNDYGAIFRGRISPGIIDAAGSPASVYLTVNAATKALESRTAAQVKSDLATTSSISYNFYQSVL